MAKNTEFNVIIRGKDALSGVLGRANANVKSFAKNIFSVGGALKAVGALGVTVGFGALFKGAIREASEAADQISRLRTAVRNAGGDFDDIRPQIEGTVNAVHKLTGAAKGDLRAALQALITQTGDVGGSIEKLGVVADVAAGRNLSLTDAAELVGKMMNGNTKIMKELGIATKNPTVAIAELEKRYKGFAESAANPIARTINRLKQGFKDNLEAIGNSITKTDAWEKSTNAIVTGLGNLAQWVEDNEALVNQLGDALFAVAEIGMTALKPFLDVALVLFYTLVDAIDMAVTGLRELKAALTLDWDKVAQLDADLQERKAARERGRLGLSSAAPVRKPRTGSGRIPRRVVGPTDDELDDAAKGNEQLRELVAKIRAERKKELDDFEADFAELVAKSTGSAVAALAAVFDKLIAKAEKLGLVAEAAELTGMRDSALAAERTLESVAFRLDEIKRTAKDTVDEYNQLKEQERQILVTLDDTNLSAADRKRLNQQLLEVDERIAEVVERIKNEMRGVAKATANAKKTASEVAEEIQQWAENAINVASAFGAIDDETARVITNVAQIGQGIARIASGDVIGGAVQAVAALGSLLENTFGHPAQERARAFRAQLRAAREEWELMLAPLGDELSGRSPLEQELVDLERQAEALRRRAAAEFLPQGERDRRSTMTPAELTAEAAAARRRGHHAGAEGLEAYRDALIQIEELFEAKAQQAGRRASEQQSAADTGGAVGDSLVTSGLAGLSYVHGDELVSLARLSTGYLHDIRDAVVGGTGAGGTTIAGGLTIHIGNIDARGSINEVATQQAVARGVDAALGTIRRNLRAAAGVPRTQ